MPVDASRSTARDGYGIIGALALFKLALHLPVLHRYGYHHDELYFIACGNHLSFGYVDHAPLTPWIARLSTVLFGESLFGLRIFSALAGALTVFVIGLLVRRLGGGRFAQLCAGLAFIIAPVYLRTGNLLTIAAFEPLVWVSCSYLLVRIIQDDNPRLWLGVGLVSGLGLLNKHSMLFFGLALALGLVLTPLRRHFRSMWLYAGAGVALLMFFPNILWQIDNGWPTLGFIVNLNERVMTNIPVVQFLAGQLLYLHPIVAPVWLAGLGYFFWSRAGKSYRILGWIYVIVLLMLLLAKSKIYYLAPAYPALLAGGSIALEQLTARYRQWTRSAILGLLLIAGGSLAPAALPLLSIQQTDAFIRATTLGMFDNIYELTGDLHGEFGWPERVEAVAEVYRSLPEEERERTVLFSRGYGSAGAIDLFGPQYGLPGAVSSDNSYYLWKRPENLETVIGVGISPKWLEQIFEEVEVAKVVELENVNPWDREFRVTICRKPKLTVEELWPQLRPW